MKALPRWIVALAVLGVPAAAQERYDVKLERAVMEIVARRIGDIRTRLAPDTVATLPLVETAADAGAQQPEHRDWQIVGAVDTLHSVASGSFQTFSERADAPPIHAAPLPPKTVSRVIDF